MAYELVDRNENSARIRVPEMRGEWLIDASRMFGNVGGNDWAIYTLHPADCAAIVRQP
jgi:hypothetical protein